ILSPAFAPLTVNCRKGFFDTAGPHSALSTCLPLWVAVTLVMCQAGMTLPALSLRWPVSISWLMRTRTMALPPWDCARMRIGSAMGILLEFVGNVRGGAGDQPPQPPSVTFTSFFA